MTYVLIIGGIDLSVGSVLALSATAAGMALQAGAPLIVAAALALGVGLGSGALNGSLSVGLGVPSFIVTLGMLEAARGGAYLISRSQTQYVGPRAEAFAVPLVGGLSASFIVALLLVVAAQLVLTRTVFGSSSDRDRYERRDRAPGRDRPAAAQARGVRSGWCPGWTGRAVSAGVPPVRRSQCRDRHGAVSDCGGRDWRHQPQWADAGRCSTAFSGF